jgi:hypothetical protein
MTRSRNLNPKVFQGESVGTNHRSAINSLKFPNTSHSRNHQHNEIRLVLSWRPRRSVRCIARFPIVYIGHRLPGSIVLGSFDGKIHAHRGFLHCRFEIGQFGQIRRDFAFNATPGMSTDFHAKYCSCYLIL